MLVVVVVVVVLVVVLMMMMVMLVCWCWYEDMGERVRQKERVIYEVRSRGAILRGSIIDYNIFCKG